jgi:hypothetical protein
MYCEERVFATYIVRSSGDSASPFEYSQFAVRRQAIDASAVPKVVLPRRPRYLALVVGTALVRIGEIQTPVRVTDHVVRPVEAPASVVVDKRFDLTVRSHARQAPVVSFAEDQAALQVEGRAVAANGGPDELRLLAGCQAQQLIAAKIDEIPVAVRMPQRAFGKDEAGGEALGFCGFEHFGQVIKRVLREQVGECLTCSIGIAPNVFLGKVGSDLQKPDGLVVITADNLPDVLLELELQEVYGIGARMEQRLNRAGIFTVAQLWNATPFQLRRVWGGINGLLFHQMLHGIDIQPPSSRFSKSIGHQHVLEPELRTTDGARNFAQHLLTKAAERLRRGDYYCRRFGVHLSWVADLGGWWDEMNFQEARETGFLLARLSFGCASPVINRCRSGSCCSTLFPPASISRICSRPTIADG